METISSARKTEFIQVFRLRPPFRFCRFVQFLEICQFPHSGSFPQILGFFQKCIFIKNQLFYLIYKLLYISIPMILNGYSSLSGIFDRFSKFKPQ